MVAFPKSVLYGARLDRLPRPGEMGACMNEGCFVKREPIFNVPTIILVLIAVLIGVQGLLDWSGADAASEAIMAYGFVPADVSERLYGGVLRHIVDLALSNPDQAAIAVSAELADYLGSHPSALPISFVTYAFLHAGWTHVLINCAWLLAFGSLVARRIGATRFLILFIGSAIGGALLHLLTHSEDVMPVIGASGAVSGIMAAAVRFAFQPGESLSGFSLNASGAYRAPALPLMQVFRDRRTLRFILLWLGINLATGLAGVPLGLTEGGIAWEAHIGGFLFGLIMFSWIDPPLNTAHLDS